MKKEQPITQEKIFELYGDYVLNHGEKPKNVYLFAKENGFEEKDFYHFFPSFDEIEKEIINHLFLKSLELASEVNDAIEISTKEKLLNVYFIFFENLTMNRSLILSILKDKITGIRKLQKLKETHKEYVKSLVFKELEIFEKAKEDFKKISEKSRQEALWLHLLSAIEFWKKDSSPDFEKTDLYIEKTIDTGFEFIENEPLKKVLDLGKFLWKEKFKIN